MDYETSDKAIEKSRIYLENVLRGNTKEVSRVNAGYSKNNTVVEHSKAYGVAVRELQEKNNSLASDVLDKVREKIDKGDLDATSIASLVDIASKLANIHKIYTPQVTIKEEQMKDGSLKRTTWGQGSVQGNTIED